MKKEVERFYWDSHKFKQLHCLTVKNLRLLKNPAYALETYSQIEKKMARKTYVTPEELFYKGYLLERGIIISKNIEVAKNCYELAAFQSNEPYYYYKLSLFLLKNQINVNLAVNYLKSLIKISDSKEFIALFHYNLACCYYQGKGVKQSYKQTAYHSQLSFKNDQRYSAFLNGYLYEMGLGVKKSFKSALSYYRLVCQEKGDYWTNKKRSKKTWKRISRCQIKSIFNGICKGYHPFIKSILSEYKNIKKLITLCEKLFNQSERSFFSFHSYRFTERQWLKMFNCKKALQIPPNVLIEINCDKDIMESVSKVIDNDSYWLMEDNTFVGLFLLQSSFNNLLSRDKQSLRYIKGTYRVRLSEGSFYLLTETDLLLTLGPEEKNFQ